MLLKNLPERPDMDLRLNYTPTDYEASLLSAANYTCSECGFKSRPHKKVLSGYMELVKVADNIQCLCALCASSIKLGRAVGGSHQHGLILHLPAFTQGQLSNVARFCHTSIVCKLRTQKAGAQIISDLMKEQVTESIYPFFKTQGAIPTMADALTFMPPPLEPKTELLFGTLRYLPNRVEYYEIYEFWYLANPTFFETIEDA